MHISRPAGSNNNFSMLNEIYATGDRIDALLELVQAGESDLYAKLQFTEGELQEVRANYWGRPGHYMHPAESVAVETALLGLGYVPGEPAEGKAILLFTKAG
jgi:hypothetical protein